MLTDDNFHDMILAPLIIDSKCFNINVKNSKWVDKDLTLVNQILAKCHRSIFAENDDNIKNYKSENTYIDFIYKIMVDAKFDAKKNIQLGIGPVFLKDTKFFKHKNYENKEFSFMYSSCPVDLNVLEDNYGPKAVEEWFIDQCKTEHLDFIIFSFFDKKLQLSWCCFYFSKNGNMCDSNGTLKISETNVFLDFITNELKQKQNDIKPFINIKPIFYVQSKNLASRKIIIPILDKFFALKKENLDKILNAKK